MILKNYEIEEIERTIGYIFTNKVLLEQAFTRRSFTEEYGGENNEVLEFLGDKVLSIAGVKALSDEYTYPTDDGEYAIEFDEADLTDILMELVCSENLASCISEMGLQKYLIMGKGDRRNNVQNDNSVKEDLFEAIVGAVTMDLDWKHVDKNGIGRWDIEKLKKVVSKMLNLKETLPQIIESLQEDYSFEDEVGQPDENRAINQLNELYQKGLISEPIYDYEQDYDDDDGTPIWRCYCRIKGENKTSYWTNSKKDAKRDASYRMLCYLMDYEYEG
jgi:ribonuclease-3